MSLTAEQDVSAGGQGFGQSIRLALYGLTAMADDIVTVLVRDVQGVEIVARLDLGDDLAEDFERSGADMLICAIDEHEMSRRWNAALRKHPPLAILNLGRDAARGRLLALRPEQRAIDDLTAESLLAILQARMRAALGAHEP